VAGVSISTLRLKPCQIRGSPQTSISDLCISPTNSLQENLRRARKSRQTGVQVERRIFLARQSGGSFDSRPIDRALPLRLARLEPFQSRIMAPLWSSHGRLPEAPNSLSMDVGVDTHDFRPWQFDEIIQIMREKAKNQSSHQLYRWLSALLRNCRPQSIRLNPRDIKRLLVCFVTARQPWSEAVFETPSHGL